jgi:hypothetical protein|nr:MAG TPA: hypothetical protein [Caudoviricetes sp.]
MEIIIISELKNVAPRFTAAIWRKYQVNETFASAKKAKVFHNLRNCHYKYVKYDSFGNELTVREINNAKLNLYGNRV